MPLITFLPNIFEAFVCPFFPHLPPRWEVVWIRSLHFSSWSSGSNSLHVELGTLLSTLQILTHVVFITILRGGCCSCHPLFTAEENDKWGHQGAGTRTHSRRASELQSCDSNPYLHVLSLHVGAWSSHSAAMWTDYAAGPPSQPLGRLFPVGQAFFTSAPSKLSFPQKGAFEMQRLTALLVALHCGFWLEMAGHWLCGSQSFKMV